MTDEFKLGRQYGEGYADGKHEYRLPRKLFHSLETLCEMTKAPELVELAEQLRPELREYGDNAYRGEPPTVAGHRAC